MILGSLLFCLGLATALIVSSSMWTLLNSEIVLKENYSGKKIPSLGGLVVLVTLLSSSAVLLLIPQMSKQNGAPLSLIILALGFGFIGLLDDLIGDKSSQGFRGHLTALFHGRVTTGALKLFGGPVVALIALSPQISGRGYLPVLVDVVAISLIANFFNLLDLAPGRCSKYALVALVICAIVSPTPAFQYCLMGTVVVALFFDVREKFMLGDTGANILGALVGLSVVSCSSDYATAFIVLVAFGLNLLSEFVSFSSLIDKVLPLKAFDHLGQTPGRRTWKRSQR